MGMFWGHRYLCCERYGCHPLSVLVPSTLGLTGILRHWAALPKRSESPGRHQAEVHDYAARFLREAPLCDRVPQFR